MRPDASDRRDTLVLRDGRRLAFTETGPADGAPVLYCHGAIGTPVEATVDLLRIAHDVGVRYIAPSRPGVGGSDPQPGRTVSDFADDVAALADALALERFSLVGVSAGGPYALAIARQLGARVRRVAVCSTLTPYHQPHHTPGLRRRIRLPLALVAGAPNLVCGIGDRVLPILARHPRMIAAVIAAHAAPAERDRLAHDEDGRAASHCFLDAACGGVTGLVEDFLTYAYGWGFAAREVETEVHLWHGAGDPLVPVEHALQLAAELPNCRVFLDPDEGHHFFRSGLEQILAALVAPAPEVGRSDAELLRAA
jgi:pimeloyl-ACP methyl ester carboxylesterase